MIVRSVIPSLFRSFWCDARLAALACVTLAGSMAGRPAVAADGGCGLWFLGSSSIRRWTSLSADMRPWVARNDGIDGATIRAVAAHLVHHPADPLPRAIIFYGGDNDIAYGITPRAALADLDAFLVARARAGLAGVPLLLLSVKPSPARWALRSQQVTFNAALAERARRVPGITYVDVARPMLRGGRPGPYYVGDGVHMNAAGYRIWHRAVADALRRAVPGNIVRACNRTRGNDAHRAGAAAGG